MKITDVRILGNARRMWSRPLLEITTSEGISGIGVTSAPASVISELISDPYSGLARKMKGEDPRQVNHIFRTLVEKWQAERGRGDEGGFIINAASAIEQALWDILGKSLGAPLHQLLGGAVCDRIPVYASAASFDEHLKITKQEIRRRSTEQLVEMATAYVKAGFRAIKFGWGKRRLASDFEAIGAIRAAIGPDIDLMLDFGCRAYEDDSWSLKEAIEHSHKLAEYDIAFWEEPLRPADFVGYRELTKESPVKIATGESLTLVRDFYRLIDERAVDIIQPDAAQIGITPFLKIAQRARDAGIACVPHGPWSGVTVAEHAQLLSVVYDTALIEYPSHFAYPSNSLRDGMLDFTHRKLISKPSQVVDGAILVSNEPGLGLGDWVPEQVASFEKFLNGEAYE